MFSRGSKVSPFHGCWRPSPSPVLRKTRVSPEDSLRWGKRCPVSACVGSGAGLGGKPVFASPVGQRIMANMELAARGWRGGIVREFGMVSFARLCLKWVTNKDLLCNKGTLLSVTRQPGRERSLGGTGTRVCMAESLCCPPETIPTVLIGHVKRNTKYRYQTRSLN